MNRIICVITVPRALKAPPPPPRCRRRRRHCRRCCCSGGHRRVRRRCGGHFDRLNLRRRCSGHTIGRPCYAPSQSPNMQSAVLHKSSDPDALNTDA